MKIFLVGGAVRDTMLNLPVKEKDWVVVGATPEDLLNKGYQPVGKDFPVFLHPETKDEYALARTERKTGNGYAGFTFYTSSNISLEEDLIRRDLTINAMAQDESGELYDPYNGQADLDNRLLRHVSDAFCEDPVRILRIARFAARYFRLGFSIAPSTLCLMKSMVIAGEVNHLVPERVWKEMSRALLEPNPEVFFQVLRRCGALERVMPELDVLFGVPQRKEYHPEIDTGVHALLSLVSAKAMSDELPTRFTALVHDLGKGTTPREEWPRHIAHEMRGARIIKKLCKRLAIPNDCRDLAMLVAEYHTHVHRALELKSATILSLLEKTNALRRPSRWQQFLIACKADARGRTGLENTPYPQSDYLETARLAVATVTTDDVRAQWPGAAGAEFGERLRSLRLNALKKFKKTATAS